MISWQSVRVLIEANRADTWCEWVMQSSATMHQLLILPASTLFYLLWCSFYNRQVNMLSRRTLWGIVSLKTIKNILSICARENFHNSLFGLQIFWLKHLQDLGGRHHSRSCVKLENVTAHRVILVQLLCFSAIFLQRLMFTPKIPYCGVVAWLPAPRWEFFFFFCLITPL